jgi:hypothetical protein
VWRAPQDDAHHNATEFSGKARLHGNHCARESVAHDDTQRHGVSSALRAAHPAAWLCPHSAVWLSRPHVSHCTSRGRSAPPPTARTITADLLGTDGLALSAMRSDDGHRPDPIGAPARHHDTSLRHLMSAERHRADRRLRQRDGPRGRCGVPRSVVPRLVSRRARTLDVRSPCRRRSRADGLSINDAPRSATGVWCHSATRTPRH